MAIVLFNNKIKDDIYMLKLKGKFEGKEGQFHMLKPKNTFLSKPISIHDIDKEGITFLYQVKGEGTKYFSTLKEGMEVDLFGPRGNGFDIENIDKDVTVIGGGIGTAPLYYLIKQIKIKYPSKYIRVYLGFTKEDYLVDEFKKIADEVIVDVGGIITHQVDFTKDDKYFACGPDIMMKSAYDLASKEGHDVIVSLENRMACAVGACLGCNVRTSGGNRKVCKDGPVFKGSEVY